MTALFGLLVAFQLKHFLCDYPLQGEFMLGKFARAGWIRPLAAHAAVHGGGTAIIALAWLWRTPGGLSLVLPFALAVADGLAHFAMDRVKASPALLGLYKALAQSEYGAIKRGADYDGINGELVLWKKQAQRMLRGNRYFWWALGFDQMFHHLTHYALVYTLWRCG